MRYRWGLGGRSAPLSDTGRSLHGSTPEAGRWECKGRKPEMHDGGTPARCCRELWLGQWPPPTASASLGELARAQSDSSITDIALYDAGAGLALVRIYEERVIPARRSIDVGTPASRQAA